MKDISMHILDIVQNSIVAGATLIEIDIIANLVNNQLTVGIRDNGKGMSEDFVRKVTDPFTTTRTTRKVGLGIPLFQAGAEQAGGSFMLQSELGIGTYIAATYEIDNVDRPPMGEVAPSIQMLITLNPDIDFVFTAQYGDDTYQLDTRELREVLDGVSFSEPGIGGWILENLNEGYNEVFSGII